MPRYDAQRLEPKWQAYWEQNRTFVTPNTPPAGAGEGEKLYVLDMFPYPSGNGLHVGHPEGYTATDIVCRYGRMRGKHVLHPMGWDAFGLPAEDYAIKTGTHPAVTTGKNIETFRRQLKMLGFSYDWSRELSTTDPDYYRWTQWIFLQLFDTWYDPAFEWTGPDGKKRVGKGRPISDLPIPAGITGDDVRRYEDKHRLAYISEAPVNWCPALGTVLANEEVVDGKSERGGHLVQRVPLKQWMLRITAYADRLANELEELSWPESIKLLQRNWIGRSTGAEVDFLVAGSGDFAEWKAARTSSGFPKEPESNVIRVYTTRPDTLFGATYMVLAPEHPLVDRITTAGQKAAVQAYKDQATRKSDLDRTDLAKEKTGCFIGAYAINPINGARIPIWIADYVLSSYGTGAIMAVPAHDERDYEFAIAFGLPIVEVVSGDSWEDDGTNKVDEKLVSVFIGGELVSRQIILRGNAINSGPYDGLKTPAVKEQITQDLNIAGIGREAVNYRLRDWLFSRQRYWGEPFPIWHELDANGQPTGLLRADTPESLPVLHPHMEDFKPTGTPEPMLSKAPESWLYQTAADGTRLKRETNSMPQWAGSCWYYLRFCDNKNSAAFIDPQLEKYWLPVDLYVGGAEHAVLHLLYSRFWHKVLFDRGHVTSPEPFHRLVNQGMILGEAELVGYQQDAPYASDVVRVLHTARDFILTDGGVRPDRRNDGTQHDVANKRHTIDSAIRKAAQRFVSKSDAVYYAAMFRVTDQIRYEEKLQLPDNSVPVMWYNNERGVDAIDRMLAAAATRSERGFEIWISAEDVVEDPKCITGFRTRSTGVPVVGKPIDSERVEKRNGKLVLTDLPWIRVDSRSFKMSKSRGNVINPDSVVSEYGADSLRLYEMFMGPLEQVKPWSMSGVEGVYRFLARVWRMFVDERAEAMTLHPAIVDIAPTAEQERILHRTIKAVTEDIEKLSFNTAISRMMEFTNEFGTADVRPRAIVEPFLPLLSPFAPHIAEELWELLGHKQSLAYYPWPAFDNSKIAEAEIEIPVQVNGKLRAKIKVPAGADQATMQRIAEADEAVQTQLAGKQIVKTVVVPGRMVNFVIKG